MKITPVNKHLLIEPAKAESATKSGIILPENTQEKPRYGTVISVADDVGKKTSSNSTIDDIMMNTGLVGKKVLYKSYSGSQAKIDGKDYLLLPEEDVLAILED